ncbi:MAG: methylthioribulose 1-phosphate dehydratase [Myxococcales bacterium]|nr:methylthioribulose 1-phosphate dehydratase [Myxococcales bacterium]
MDFRLESEFEQEIRSLCELIRWLHARGFTPATSSNFSVRPQGARDIFAVSRTGVDKSTFSPDQMMLVDASTGAARVPRDARPSAETLIHVVLYELFPEAACILHTHSVPGTVLSMQRASEGRIVFRDFEILKGLEHHDSHDVEEVLPIFANTQQMPELAARLRAHVGEHPELAGFLIEGHGLYTWGANVAAARRHLEVFEFLLECTLHLQR